MLTNNFKIAALNDRLWGGTQSSSRSYIFKNWRGDDLPRIYTDLVYLFSTAYLAVGTGTTPATEDDYTAESMDSSLTRFSTVTDLSSVKSTDITKNNCGYWITISRAYQNDTDHDITITEIICGGYPVSSSSARAENNLVLFFREIIDPVVIHPGDLVGFTVKIGETTEVSVS